MNLIPFKNVSLLNFAENESRAKMMAALEKIRAQFGKTYGLHTADEISSNHLSLIKSLNPANPQQIIGSVQCANLSEAEIALKKMSEGAPSWKKTSADKRIQLLLD